MTSRGEHHECQTLMETDLHGYLESMVRKVVTRMANGGEFPMKRCNDQTANWLNS